MKMLAGWVLVGLLLAGLPAQAQDPDDGLPQPPTRTFSPLDAFDPPYLRVSDETLALLRRWVDRAARKVQDWSRPRRFRRMTKKVNKVLHNVRKQIAEQQDYSNYLAKTLELDLLQTRPLSLAGPPADYHTWS